MLQSQSALGRTRVQQRSRLAVFASNATVSATPLLTLKFVKQHRQGVRHAPSSEPSTAVLLEERRCSGDAASTSGAAPAPAQEWDIGAAPGNGDRGSGAAGGGSAAGDLLQLREAVDAAAERVAERAGLHVHHGAGQQQQQQAQLPQQQPQQLPQQQQQHRPQRRQQGAPAAAPAAAAAGEGAQRRRRAGGPWGVVAGFGEWSAYCRLHASSPSLPHWIEAAKGLRPLVQAVRGPQQAQQAWELVALLASRPLPPPAAHLVAGRAVELVNLSLEKGDYSILHALLASRDRFALGRRAAESLLRAALAADLEPGELQAVMRLAPRGQLGARAYFALVSSFEGRGRVAEALQCYQQMQVLGIRLSPAMEATYKRLKEGRAAASRHSLAAHR